MTPELDALEVSAEEKEVLAERCASFVCDPGSALTLEEFVRRMQNERKPGRGTEPAQVSS